MRISFNIRNGMSKPELEMPKVFFGHLALVIGQAWFNTVR